MRATPNRDLKVAGVSGVSARRGLGLPGAAAILASALAARPAGAGQPAAAAETAEPDADVVASGLVAAPPEAVYAWLLDLRHQAELWPDYCARNWEFGLVTEGVGASAVVTYTAGGWRRRLAATLSKAEPNRRITVDHPGDKGFVTTWTMEPVEGGTRLEVHTWIQPPPRPFRKLYFSHVRPEWQGCHAQTIGRLDAELRAAGAVAGKAAGSAPAESAPEAGGLAAVSLEAPAVGEARPPAAGAGADDPGWTARVGEVAVEDAPAVGTSAAPANAAPGASGVAEGGAPSGGAGVPEAAGDEAPAASPPASAPPAEGPAAETVVGQAAPTAAPPTPAALPEPDPELGAAPRIRPAGR